MLTAIEFNDDSWVVTGEVDDETLDGCLSSEMKP